jgi:Uma2 family endonuclease
MFYDNYRKLSTNSLPFGESMINSLIEPISEHRVLLRHLSWDSYQTILHTLGQRRNTKLTYYRTTLEIMTPLEEHENSSALIGNFVTILTEELDLPIKTMDSTTLSRKDLASGAEPDKCYYITNERQVRGKRVDLQTDPPPDLVVEVEVDITHTDINKNELYAEMGIAEFWRYDGNVLTIYLLQEIQYVESDNSDLFPGIAKERLYEFLQNCQECGETQAKRLLRRSIS